MTVSFLQLLSIRKAILAGACFGAAVLGASGSVEAAVLVSYTLPTSGGTSTSSPVGTVHGNATATSYSAHGGTMIGTTGTHYIRVDDGTNASKLGTISAAITNNMYGEFSVAAKADMELNLESLQFGMRNDRGITGQTFSVHLRSSLDNFASDIASVTQTRVNDEVTQGPDSKTVDLSGTMFQQLEGNVTFRLYMVTNIANNTGSSENIRIMPNIVLSGTAAPVPEPGLVASAGIVGALLLGRRRNVRSA